MSWSSSTTSRPPKRSSPNSVWSWKARRSSKGPRSISLIGLKGVRATLALMRTPDGHGRIELDKFHTPKAIRTETGNAPVNALGIRRIMFAVDDIDDVVARLLSHGARLVGEVVQYEDTYRLAYIRGPEGIIVGLSEQLK